jgi:hypothetical protein
LCSGAPPMVLGCIRRIAPCTHCAPGQPLGPDDSKFHSPLGVNLSMTDPFFRLMGQLLTNNPLRFERLITSQSEFKRRPRQSLFPRFTSTSQLALTLGRHPPQTPRRILKWSTRIAKLLNLPLPSSRPNLIKLAGSSNSVYQMSLSQKR